MIWETYFSNEEAARYLETYKAYENKPPDILKERTDSDFSSRVSKEYQYKTDLTIMMTFNWFSLSLRLQSVWLQWRSSAKQMLQLLSTPSRYMYSVSPCVADKIAVVSFLCRQWRNWSIHPKKTLPFVLAWVLKRCVQMWRIPESLISL